MISFCLKTLPFILLFVVIASELCLRISGLPQGRFDFMQTSPEGFYPPNATITIDLGPATYTLHTNELGLRNPKVIPIPPPALQVVALGDSVTDGFYVADEETFPAQLEFHLRWLGQNATVFNVSRGGASIEKETELLRSVRDRLKPTVVILTFVTNDLAELKNSKGGTFETHSRSNTVQVFLLRKSAFVEALMSFQLLGRFIVPFPRNSAQSISSAPTHVETAKEFSQLFAQRYHDSDMLAFQNPQTSATAALFKLYRDRLVDLKKLCDEMQAALVVAYFPAYPEVYDSSLKSKALTFLLQTSAELGNAFVDFTPALRAAANSRNLHFAPADFHPSSQAYAVMGETMANSLKAQRLLP